MVRMWNNRDQLAVGLMQAIIRAIQMYPAPGWVRGDAAASDEILQQLVQLRSAYDELLKQYEAIVADNSVGVTGLASLTDVFTFRFRYTTEHLQDILDEARTTWGQIFKIVGPDLFGPKTPRSIETNLRRFLLEADRRRTRITINDIDLNTIKIHLHALALINVYPLKAQAGGGQELIALTDKGRAELVRMMAVKSEFPAADQQA
jgi:hypothetical protein